MGKKERKKERKKESLIHDGWLASTHRCAVEDLVLAQWRGQVCCSTRFSTLCSVSLSAQLTSTGGLSEAEPD